jgi:REP element-mobilizing transposase RayT
MPRANRHFVPGLVWHITHRCHKRSFLLKFAQDRAAYIRWLHEARKRHGLCILDYMITSNHVHLLIKDTGEDIISRAMQLAAGSTGREYNRRKKRQGAFWEDRYHATAVEDNEHLHRCITYIDLNMVRAGVISHPAQWAHGGYIEIQTPPKRYRVIDLEALTESCGFQSVPQLQEAHREWIEAQLVNGTNERDPDWSHAIALGSEQFVKRIQSQLGIKATHRGIDEVDERHVLREASAPYNANFGGEIGRLRRDNGFLWRLSDGSTDT